VIIDEIPFTNEAIEIYIKEAEKRMEQLSPSFQEFNKLKKLVSIAKERLKKHKIF
jgi:hypothetical protein